MEKELFIGIDFSKKTFDVSIIARNQPEEVHCRKFDNSKAGCLELLSRVKGQGNSTKEEWLFCGEHTGLYSLLYK
jgi:transposase